MLEAEDFIDQQPGKHLFMFHHQHPPLSTYRRKLVPEEAAQVHDRQQTAAQVGDTLDPGFDPR
ncbi:hypothetical protein D3C81_2089780 [compost metagenome]